MGDLEKQSTGKRGGRRPGAGRPPSKVLRARDAWMAESDRLIVENLPELIGNLLMLANGGYEQIEEEWVPEELQKEGKVTWETKRSKKPQPGMVCIKRKVSFAAPDRGANIYLIDRIFGRPKQSMEHAGPNGMAIPVAIEAIIASVYGAEAAVIDVGEDVDTQSD